MKFFVYGTLKRGGPNYWLLKDSIFLGVATTKEKYHMYSYGGFPFIVKDDSGYAIKGELFEVKNSHVVNNLDRLEGNKTFYTRYEREVVNLIDSTTSVAWVYELPDNKQEKPLAPLYNNSFYEW